MSASFEVHELLEADDTFGLGGRMGWYAKGHIEPERFLLAAIEMELDYEGRVPRCSVEDVKHVQWRTVPIAGVPGGRFVEGDGRGAWEATVLEWPGGGWARVECQIVECHEQAKALEFPITMPWSGKSLYLRVCSEHEAEYRQWHAARVAEAVAAAKVGAA